MPQTSRPHLNKRQISFVKAHILDGLSIGHSVLKAGYRISSGRIDDASSYGCKLLKQPRIKAFVSKLREKQHGEMVLTANEKRAFLARCLRADLSSGKVDGDLVQEVREEVDKEGNVKRVVKLVSKMDALREDNIMSGDRFQDRQPQASNPFLMIVSLGKSSGPASLLGQSQSVPHTPTLRDASNVIEAEIVSDSTRVNDP
jgi:phage terminase small subunit